LNTLLKKTPILLTFGLLIGISEPLYSQSAPDHEAIEQAILTLFEGMRQADSTLILSVTHPEMSLQTTMRNPEGEVMVRSMPAQAFVQTAGGPREDVWDEQISGLIIQQDGPLASAWMNYQFYRNVEFSHCGVNAMTLVRQKEGWKITSIIDTRRREGCN